MLVNQNVKYVSEIDRMSAVFAALGDSTRLAILERLSLGQASVQELATPFKITLPAISRHLKILERAGLITRRQHAQWRQCSLDINTLSEVASWAETYKNAWESNFDKLDSYIDALNSKRTTEENKT